MPSLIFFVSKKGTTELRPVIDYRHINEITKRKGYPLPLIQNSIQNLGNAKIFSKLDLPEAYNLIHVSQCSEHLTAFRCCYGHYQYKVMPFGLKNAPAVFQEFITSIFSDLIDLSLQIYLDNILLYSEDKESHLELLAEVFKRLKNNHLYVKPAKCEFFCTKIIYLGMEISRNGIQPDESGAKAIQQWTLPRTVKELQRFCGFVNYY